MFANFFIDRPIFACVLSIVLVLAGSIAYFGLPVAQYPEIAPPTVSVTASFPGANAELVAQSVATPIELQVNGVERMLYMSSTSTNDGQMTLTVTFELGTNLDIAQVQVQNRVNMAIPKLPKAVRDLGVTVKKKSPSIILCVNLVSRKDPATGKLYMNIIDLSNYATLQVKDQLARVQGVGDVTILGEREYSMLINQDPRQMFARGLVSEDLANAILRYNAVYAAGAIGAAPAPLGLAFQWPVQTQGQLSTPREFDAIILRADKDGRFVFMGNVARAELGAKAYDVESTLDGEPSITLAIYQLPGSNALETAQALYKRMKELEAQFPLVLEGGKLVPQIEYHIRYDTTPFIETSVETVIHTLFEAIILVFLVVLVFLQTWRASLIPLLAVPVAIVGTFAVMAMMGFSVNNLTLFGLVLAIGIVVDDAIVVVEAVEHHMEHGLSPKEATRKAMAEVSGPVVAIALVLSCVFVPAAFIPGITGQFFKQFALTIAVSTVLSAFNSLTLSPALCPLLLRPKSAKQDIVTRGLNFGLGWFFRGFNKVFDRTANGYTRGVKLLLRGSAISLLLYGGLLALAYFGITSLPTGFIPEQDKGYLLLDFQLEDGASLERTRNVMSRVDQIVKETDGVDHRLTVTGQSMVTNAVAPNSASMFVILKSFHDRKGKQQHANDVMANLRERLKEIRKDPTLDHPPIFIFGAPPVDGLGSTGGFKLMVQDRGNVGLATLDAMSRKLARSAGQAEGLAGAASTFRANTPQLRADLDRVKAARMGVPLDVAYGALGSYFGKRYINDFFNSGRNFNVNLTSPPEARASERDIGLIYVRNQTNGMVPLQSLLVGDLGDPGRLKNVTGPAMVVRYNLWPAAPINGAPRPGVSSGEGMAIMDQLAARDLPRSFGYEWTDLSYQERATGNTAAIVFALAVVLVFLVLAAQYESWSLPLAVILVVPMCVLGAVAGIAVRGMDINIFTQIGLVTLVGLACKNAILIVEFAKQQHEQGKPLMDATLEACRLRLRPILMTSFAFILGVVPLMLGTGAGAEMRQTLGTAVFSGMLGVTIFGIFLTPVFFYVIQRLGGRKESEPPEGQQA